VIIICTTEMLEGETAEADREQDLWFERDYNVQGYYAVMIFPKTCWKQVEELIVKPPPIQ
jgi:hypothetical protein